MTTDRTRLAEKAWPLDGYAPGNYFCTCCICKLTFTGDKRAVQCLECAVKSVKAGLALALAVVEAARKYHDASAAFNLIRNSGGEPSAILSASHVLAVAGEELDQALAAFDGGRA